MVKVKALIRKDGTVSLEVDGASGIACKDLTAALERALGTTMEVQEKPEMYVELDETVQKLYNSN